MDSPKTLTRQEVAALLAELERDNLKHYVARNRHRDHALAVFMLEAGLRVGEVAQLTLGDVLFNAEPVRTLIIRPAIAKNHVERPIPVSRTLHIEILNCHDNLWYYHNDRPDTFCFYRTAPTTHLTTRSIQAIIRRAALASLGRPIHPHMLRHTFATNLMRVTSARIVQELLGHADLRSTQIYTHPNGEDLAAAIAARDAQERRTSP